MTAEPGEPSTSPWSIHACERERLLTVSSALGDQVWKLSLELEGGSDGAGGDAGDLDPIGARHDDVGQQQVVGAVLQRPFGLHPIGAHAHAMARALQGAFQKAAQGGIVLGEEDAGHT